jgi:sortase A
LRTFRTVLGVIGELTITAGVILVLFVVWQLGYVGVVDSRRQADVVASAEREFAAQRSTPAPAQGIPGNTESTGSPTASDNATPNAAPDSAAASGGVFGILRIPRLGTDWAKPIFDGVGLDVLARGLGHYPQTQSPGQAGNVALAGHRAGHGNPLIDIDAIQPGDVLVLETRDTYFVYHAVRHEIVPPTTVEVLAPTPGEPGVTPTQQYLTLTSCDPRYGSTNRYIVFAQLAQSVPRGQSLPVGTLDEPA